MNIVWVILFVIMWFSNILIICFNNNNNKKESGELHSYLQFQQLVKVRLGFYQGCVGQLKDRITEEGKELFLVNIQSCKSDNVGEVTDKFVYLKESEIEVLIN